MAIYTLEEIINKTGARPEDIKLASSADSTETTPTKESVFTKIKNGLKSIGGSLISSEKGFGESIAGALPSSIPGSAGYQENQLQQQRQEEQKLFSEQLAGLQKLKAMGKDTTKLEKYLSEAMGTPVQDVSTIVPSVNKTPGQVLGEGLGVGLDIVTAGVGGKVAKDTAKLGIKTLAKNIATGAGIGYGYDVTQGLQNKEGVKSFVPGTGTIIGGGLPIIGSALSKGATKASELAKESVSSFKNATGSVIDTTKNIGKGIKNFTGQTVESISAIPSRVATNVAEKQAVRESIKQLPLQTAREAVNNGVDMLDVKTILKIPTEQKQPLKKLVDIVQRYASGESKVNPIEVVGKPIINRVKQLETKASTVGKKLGEVSKELGDVSEADLVYPIMEKLRKVNGLSGLKFGDEGLDFSNTVLATAETAGDRKAIEQIFNEAVKAGTGQQKHLLRQELFESLGGKKRSGVQLTGTQEKAYEAIRSGISDVLDNKNNQYKALNNEYRKLISPINELKKIIQVTDGDGAELSAGLLARRLTSSAMSNPRVRGILKMLDNATKIKGKTSPSVETLQDFYNILNKYYDIAPKTGFQNLVKEGIGGTGIISQVSEAVGGLVGKTNAVRQASLEKLLKDVLK